MQAIPMVLSGIGTVISSFGMIQQARSVRAESKAQARVIQANALTDSYDAQFNEDAARANEKEALLQGQAKKDQIRRQGRYAKASATAQLARQGLDLGSVSFSDALDQVVMDTEYQVAQTGYESAVAGAGLRSQALGFKRKGRSAFVIGQHQAVLTRQAGRNKSRSLYTSAAGNLVGGFGDALALKPT